MLSRRFIQQNLHRSKLSQQVKNCQIKYSSADKSTLLLVEHDEKQINPSVYSGIKAAKQLNNEELLGFIVTKNENLVKEASKHFHKLIHINQEYQVAEEYEQALLKYIQNNQQDIKHVIGSHTVFTKNILPKLGSQLKSQPIVDIIQILNDYEFIKPIYAGNALAQIKFKPKQNLPLIMTVRPTSFDKDSNGLNNSSSNGSSNNSNVIIESIEIKSEKTPKLLNRINANENGASSRPDLLQAQRIVSGGRGLKNGDNFKYLYELADAMGNCAVGATRAAVDDGYVSNDLQVGQTGKVVAPELYIAVGVSGAIQHLAGMKDSKVIVAINKDKEAPIFQVADYGIVGDLFEIVPQMTLNLKK
ncbi:electron transfer flavoprotein alpha subunit [Naegleria gruberi]|uniref:Electron transfer flavoprotein subunit alpha n=1 Tax=Naegleria gruberi TaxID=5762 RepID=D2VT89_NAEGR|nr:electron transfer flavoprotein alpha subunit [Naegleria gruberi]EFC40105.1 electron transfer flavoprotein alpha subunit [Naegleria gruberi]|eukprot:XP_002672849.1 electron transfer flavoprotein alpha subunit [Naegleria gruberi strain NEG-M]